MQIRLSDHFTYQRLIRFVLPSIVMMICTSMYSIVDGLFVSNYAGKTAFAAINLVFPVSMGVAAIGFMIGSGGSAIVAKTLGEKKEEKANEYFSMLIYTSLILSIVLSVIGFFSIEHICRAFGASGELLKHSSTYGRIMFISQPAFMMQTIFYNFFITAEKPSYSLRLSLTSGLINILFDYLFIGVLNYGVAGAAIATAMGEFVGGLFPLFYFSRKNSSRLRLVKPVFYPKVLLYTCLNGSSEFMTNASSSVVNMLYNHQLMKIAGENGVAAYGVIMYANFIFSAIYLGYSMGSAPITSYHYGAGNHSELKNMLRKSLSLLAITGCTLTIISELFAYPLIHIFVGYDNDLFLMTLGGFRLYALSFLINGVNIWASSFFTALNNGLVSGLIAFLRTLLFQIGSIMILPLLLGLNGIWLSVVTAELLTLIISTYFLRSRRKQYHYAS